MIKICGVTNPADAEMVCNMGADMVGVIVDVSVSTPREIEIEQAAKVFGDIPENVGKVVVTMPQSLDGAVDILDKLNPDYLQIHTDLPPSKLQEIRDETDTRIIGVLSVSKKYSDPDEAIDRAKGVAGVSDLLLLDTRVSSGSGGTGETHDWYISSEIRNNLDTPLILAGGLNPSNIQEAIERVSPFGVDVASGVESEPGKKDPELVRKFIQEVRKFD